MELFISMTGGQKMKEVLCSSNLLDENSCQFWTRSLPSVLRAMLQIMYPLYRDESFLDFIHFPVYPESKITFLVMGMGHTGGFKRIIC